MPSLHKSCIYHQMCDMTIAQGFLAQAPLLWGGKGERRSFTGRGISPLKIAHLSEKLLSIGDHLKIKPG